MSSPAAAAAVAAGALSASSANNRVNPTHFAELMRSIGLDKVAPLDERSKILSASASSGDNLFMRGTAPLLEPGAQASAVSFEALMNGGSSVMHYRERAGYPIPTGLQVEIDLIVELVSAWWQ